MRIGVSNTESESNDFGFELRQKLIDKIPDSEVKKRNEKSVRISYLVSDQMCYFSLFESVLVSNDGITYHDPEKFHYFYNIDTITSKIYHQDLSDMLDDLMFDLIESDILEIYNIRDWKLKSIGV